MKQALYIRAEETKEAFSSLWMLGKLYGVGLHLPATLH